MKNVRLLSLTPAALVVTALLLSNPGVTDQGWFGATLSATPRVVSGNPQLTVLHSFVSAGAAHPNAPLILGSDGLYYGTTSDGGAANLGTIFTMTTEGVINILHTFTGDYIDGAHPSGALVEANDGNFYGTTESGGTSGAGTFFSMAPDHVVTVRYSFTGGSDGNSPGAILQGADGNFYGTTAAGGGSGVGAIFRVASDGNLTVLHTFLGSEADGATPHGALIQDIDENIYGTTQEGGESNQGTVFMMSRCDDSVTVLHSFTAGQDGGGPSAALLKAADGNLYGTTRFGGDFGEGTIFAIAPDGITFTLLYSFSRGPGGYDTLGAALIQSPDGNLHGTTSRGGDAGLGTAFTITLDKNFTILHAFTGGTMDGSSPAAALLRAEDGRFYGTTRFGGAPDQGTAFSLMPDGTIVILNAFAGGDDGIQPGSALVQDIDGHFLGTTAAGGAFGGGTVFKTTPDGDVTILHSFVGVEAAGSSRSAVVRGTDGSYYGTSNFDGAGGQGTVFRITAEGSYTVLHSFAGGATDGSYATAPLIRAIDGDFYGTTANGGAMGQGTVFVMTPEGAVTVLHSFAGGPADGTAPYAALIQAVDGDFYGTTVVGGASNRGTLFRMTSGGIVTVVHSFIGGQDGSYPTAASLVQATDGNIYGITQSGGSHTQGMAFMVTPAGSYSVLHQFAGGAMDASYPAAGLIQAADGNLYGTSQVGGTHGVGTIFKMTPSGDVTVLYSFNGEDGYTPLFSVVQGSDGDFYGTTAGGGSVGLGVVFRLSIPQKATITYPTNGKLSADLSLPVQWTTILDVEAYYLYIGTTLGAKNLVNTGELHQTSYLANGVPGGETVFARIHTKVGGVWRFNDSSFRTSVPTPVVATLIAPVNGATDVDLTLPIQWTAVPDVQAYYLYVGSTLGAFDLVNSREIQQTSYVANGVPNGERVFARIFAKVGGVWRFSDSAFTTAASAVTAVATVTTPVNGATNADLTLPIQWTAVPNAQAYYLYLGTTLGARDIVNSREIQQTSYVANNVPDGTMLFARIYTKFRGVWRFSDSTFTTAAVPVRVVATLTSPVNGAILVDPTQPIQWTTVANAQAYYLYVGTTVGAKDLVNTGEIQRTSHVPLGVPFGQTVFVRIFVKVGGVWRFSDSTFTTIGES